MITVYLNRQLHHPHVRQFFGRTSLSAWCDQLPQQKVYVVYATVGPTKILTINLFIIAGALISSAYGNTVQKDLWDALNTQAVNENVQLPATVETIMETWTRQMGYPVINISRLYDSANSAVASQVHRRYRRRYKNFHYYSFFSLFLSKFLAKILANEKWEFKWQEWL